MKKPQIYIFENRKLRNLCDNDLLETIMAKFSLIAFSHTP